MKKTVLMLTDFYLPGYKAGGPIRTLANIVDQLGDRLHFRVVTRDRDLGDSQAYPRIRLGRWLPLAQGELLYLPPGIRSLFTLCGILRSPGYQTLYLNSLMSVKYSVFPLLLVRLGLVRDKTVVLAPRGECARSALQIKALRKRLFFLASRLLRLHGNLVWHASSEHEAGDIAREFGGGDPSSLTVRVAPDLPQRAVPAGTWEPREKMPGSLRIIFLGRIARMKNLRFALKVLSGVRGEVTLNICGPMEDRPYWEECGKLIRELERSVSITYHGTVDHERVAELLARNHILFLPTLGENFCHAAVEAFQAGCPVLISDRTPWRGLEREGVGWDLPLEEPERFTRVLQQCVEMENEHYRALSEKAFRYGRKFADDEEIRERTINLFMR